ncbi:MAG: tetratricopeptide repeat protein, partial [Armatimonadota bacterium]
QSLIKDYPNYAEPYRCMVYCYSNFGNLNECYAAIDKAVELASDPQIKRNYRQDRAWFYMRGQRKQDSIAECQSLIKDYPNSAEPYRCMADCYLNMWKLDECYAAIDKAIELASDPQIKKNYRQDRAWFYVKGGRCQDALAECESLIKDYPNSAEPYRYLADCYVGMGKVTEFCAAMDKAAELATTPVVKSEMLFVKAELLVVNMRDYKSAIPVLRKLLADYPDCIFSKPLVPAFLVLALEETEQLDEAAEVLKSSLPKDATPDQRAANAIQIANIYFNAKRYIEAIKAFKEVRSLKDAPSETKAQATYRSGLCYQAIKFNNSARMCMNEVIKRYSGSQWARQARGQLYLWGELKPAGVTNGEMQ